ncbi:MAG: alpha/beta hydrolase [Clostridia bacterium]|nr:alpha/beta hydrolase [Clostridia bacterium]
MTKLKYPVLMVHGMGFRDSRHIGYWGRIPKALEREGCTVFFGGQDSNGTVEDNAVYLAEKIKATAREHGIQKFNVIAHSKGGLDIRYAISHLGMEQYIASVSTISTPHNGSLTVDRLMRFPQPLIRMIGGCSDLWLRLCGDKKPNAYRVFQSLTTEHARKFNQENPDAEGIYYQSFAFTFKTAFSDIMLWFPHFVVKIFEGENDGLLAPRAVQWTNFRGVYKSNSNRGISHCDEVDMRRFRFTKKQGDGISDIVDFYTALIHELAEKGY